jgi:endonuclease YncB( thermonuclease family)
LGLWGSGLLQPAATPRTAAVSTSRGLTFGLCEQGGLTNCVASGDSFYLGGKTIRIANIEAPQLYGAACPRESELGGVAAKKLQSLLNSGEIRLSRVGEDMERYGMLLRKVAVSGSDVGTKMVEAGLAREIGDLTRSWC